MPKARNIVSKLPCFHEACKNFTALRLSSIYIHFFLFIHL